MKILVTGSSGHLGEALMRVLQQQNREVLGIDIKAGAYTQKVGSIADSAFVYDCMQGVDAVLHAATLHKPHVATHSKQDFIDTNITGTLNLLEASLKVGVQSFIFTSTTSTFGDAMMPVEGGPSTWVTEELTPIPKNIYGTTKIAAEHLCKLFYRNHKLPCLILRTSRFFPEEDDNAAIRQEYSNSNLKANEFLYRRVDVEDAVHAHLLAIEKAPKIGFGCYIISATTPFTRDHLLQLNSDASVVVNELYPDVEEIYGSLGWKLFPKMGRVYVNESARNALGWKPKYDFRYILDALKAGKDPRSLLSIEIGTKGYHDQLFDDGPYPT